MYKMVTVGVVLALGTACSSSRHSPEEKYVLVATNTKLAYWQEAAKGLASAATKLNVKAEMVGPDTYDPNAERDAFKKAAAGKPSGILVSVADPEVMKAEIDSAIAAGIPVVTMDSDAPASKRLFFIGTDNYQAGMTGGKRLVEKLKGKGNVVVFTIPTQANLAERLRGYQDAIAHTEIKIVQTVDSRGDANMVFDKAMEMVEKEKIKIDAFVCLEATAGSEIAEVLGRRKVTDKVVIAMDTDEGTLNGIEKGVIAATIGQKPFTMASYGLHLVDEVFHSKPASLDGDWAKNLESPFPWAVDTGSALIDSANLKAIREAVGKK